jgi:Sulfotransferase domain
LSFFFDARFQKYVSTNSQKTLVRQARERLYAKFYNVPALQKQPHLISFDASSGYLFYSTLLPRRIFCVMPWIRLVIVLRNPTDRLYHHYRSAQGKGLRLSFEEWIDKDFRLLNDVGFFELNNATSSTTSSSSLPWSESIPINNMTLQDIAWFQYQQQSLEGAVGRSLYEVQLRQWFQALRAIGRKPSKSVLIVWTNDLIDNPQVELTRIAQFLQLPPANASSSTSILKTSTSSSAASLIAQINATTMTGMNSQTRQRLDDFFRPYNERLKDILKGFGIPDSGSGLSALPMPKKRP